MRSKGFFIGLFVLAITFGCDFQKLPLPAEKAGITAFGANDTSYIEINPVWNSASLGIQLNKPTDVIEGPDGYLWVTNSGSGQILALSKSGEVIHQHNFDQINTILNPVAISLDSKLNLLAVNASSTIYIWNEYVNTVGVDAVAFKGVFRRVNGDTVHYSVENTVAMLQANIDSLTFQEYLYSTDAADIQRAAAVQEFYVSRKGQQKYYGIAAGKSGSNAVYAADAFENRISRFVLVPKARIRLKNHVQLFSYAGRFDKNIVTYGSGAGTVDMPRGIYMDKTGNLYLTQWGGNFLVQKLLAGTYISEYELHKHPIMDLNRFQQPTDITLDDQNNIFVVDRGWKRVFKFDNENPGAGKEISLGNKGLGIAEFVDPQGIVVADNVVYVVDAGANEIRRFQLSISDKDIPVEPGGNQP